MLEQHVRQYYQYYFVDRLVLKIQHAVTPIQVTLCGGFIGLLVPIALYYEKIWLAILLLLTSGYFDTIDGTIARNRNLCSDLGTLLDIVMDRLVECAVLLGIWLIAPNERSLLCLLMLSSILLCVTSFLTVGIFTENHSDKSFHYSPGMIERPEAFIFFILMLLFSDYFMMLAITFILLVLYTTLLRIYEFSRIKNRV